MNAEPKSPTEIVAEYMAGGITDEITPEQAEVLEELFAMFDESERR